MKEKLTSVKNLAASPKGKTKWKKIKAMSEADIQAAALKDQDALPISKAQLTQFKRVKPIKNINVKKIREKMLGLTQSEFSAYFGIPLRTLQQWEQGRSKPRGVARNFLRVIERNPKAVQRALN